MAEMTLIDALREAMDEELARDERVFITGEDVGPRGGVFRATMGLYDKYGPSRIIDSPLAELSIVAIGIGAAVAGMHPICEIQFAAFIHPCIDLWIALLQGISHAIQNELDALFLRH